MCTKNAQSVNPFRVHVKYAKWNIHKTWTHLKHFDWHQNSQHALWSEWSARPFQLMGSIWQYSNLLLFKQKEAGIDKGDTNVPCWGTVLRHITMATTVPTYIYIIQGSCCLLEICVNRRERLRILHQWHEKCVQYNLELTHITKPKWCSNLTVAHGL